MSQQILSNQHITARIEYGDTLKIVSTAPVTTDDEGGVFAAIQQWKGADFEKAFKRKNIKAAWDQLVAPGKVSIAKMKAFFEKYRLSFTALNIAHEVLFKYQADVNGSSTNRKLGDYHFYFIKHNGRMYPFEKDRTTYQRRHFKTDVEPLRAPRRSMAAPRAFTYTLYAQDLDALVEILRKSPEDNDVPADRQVISIAYGESINDLYLWFKQEHNYEPVAIVKNRQLTGLKLWFDRPIVIHGGFGEAMSDPKAFNEALNAFKRGMFHESHRSVYSDDLSTFFTEGRKAHLWCGLDPAAPMFSVGVDVKSAYPAAAMQMEKIPVFMRTDDFRAYGGEPLEDYSIYLVRNDQPNDILRYILADRPLCGISGWSLRRCGLTFPIMAVCKPSHLAKNPWRELVTEMFHREVVDDDGKKAVMNYIIGMTGKMYDEHQEGFLCSTWQEARNLCASADDVTSRSDLGGFIATRKSPRVVLQDGFYAFQFFVYDINRWQMFNLGRQLQQGGARIYGILSDKLWCDLIPADLPLVTSGKRTLATLGGYKAEGASEMDKGRVPTKQHVFHDPVPLLIRPEVTFTKVLAICSSSNTFVEGSAGTRKTTLCFANLDPATTLCVCPNNYQRETQSNRFLCDAITTHEFLGLKVATDGAAVAHKAPYNVSKYTHIIFEELPQNAIPLIVRIIGRVLEAQDTPKVWIANGDLFQNNNAEALNNIGDRDAYILRILPRAFPNVIRLSINYRLTCATHPAPASDPGWRCECPALLAERQKMDDIRTALKAGDDVMEVVRRFNLQTFTDRNYLSRFGIKKVITQSNATAHALNQYLHPEDDHIGMMVVAKPFTNIKTLIKNKEYKVEAMDNETYTIEGKTYGKGVFRRPAGKTCDSIQGDTIAEPYAVFDVVDEDGKVPWFIRRRWFYTAISRTESFDRLWIYIGKPLVSMKDADEKIRQYKEDDEAKGRPGGLTTPQMMAQLKRDNFCCWICHQRVEVVYEDKDRRAYSMDRINNDIGHRKDNVRTAHTGCNAAQGNAAKIRDIQEEDHAAQDL